MSTIAATAKLFGEGTWAIGVGRPAAASRMPAPPLSAQGSGELEVCA